MKTQSFFKIIFFFLFVFTAQKLFSQTKEKADTSTLQLTLEEAKQYAVQNSYAMRMAELDLKSAKEKIWETTAIGLPQVSATIAYQHIFNTEDKKMSFGPSFYPDETQMNSSISKGQDLLQFFHPGQEISVMLPDNTTGTLTVSQLIFSGEYLVGLQASRTYYALTELSAAKSERDIKESAVNAYFMSLTLEENYKILKESATVINKILEDMQGMNKAGFAEETDIDQLKITKNQLDLAIESLERSQKLSKRLLKFQLGIDFDRNIVLKDSLQTVIMKENVDRRVMESLILENNVDYKLLETNENAQLLLLKQQKSKYLPTLAAFYRYQKMLNEPALNFNPENVIGINIEIPIFSSFQRKSRVAQARHSWEKAKIQKEQATNGLKLEYLQAQNDYLSALSNYNTWKDSRDLAKRIYERTAIKYSSGMATSMDLSQAQRQFLETENNYFTSVLNLLKAQTKIDKLLGKL